MTKPLRSLIEAAVAASTPPGAEEPDPDRLARQPVFRLTPFVETMGRTQDGRRKEFWWEREWRKVGELVFEPNAVAAAIAPERDHDRLRAALRSIPGYRTLRLVDAFWSDERIADAVDGLAAGPFPG